MVADVGFDQVANNSCVGWHVRLGMVLLAEQNPQTHSRVTHLLVEVHVALTGGPIEALAALEHKLVVFRVEMLEEFSA